MPVFSCTESSVCRWAVLLFILSASVGGAGKASAAESQQSKAVRGAVWTAETIRTLRANQDYKTLLALVFAEYASTQPQYRRGTAFAQDLASVQALAAVPATISLDPDLNPTVFRAMLEQLRSTRYIDKDALNALIAELTRKPPGLPPEEAVLPLSTTASKVAFGMFLRKHLDGAFAAASSAPMTHVSSTILRQIRGMPALTGTVQSTVAAASLPESLKQTLMTVATARGAIDPVSLVNQATTSLRDTRARFTEATSGLLEIGRHQSFQRLSNDIAHANRALQLTQSVPSASATFDVLADLAQHVRLPDAVVGTINDVANVGSAIESTISTISRVSSSAATLGSIGSAGLGLLTTSGIGAFVGSIGSLFGGGLFSSGPSNQEILDAIKQVSADVQRLHRDMDARFDKVDRRLDELNRQLDARFTALSEQLNRIEIRVDEVIESTQNIERSLLQVERELNRLSLNTLGGWTQDRRDELSRGVNELSDWIYRADGGSQDFQERDFQRLAAYFRDIARDEAARPPLNGLESVSDSFDYAVVADRLNASQLYALNYLLLYHREGAAPLSTLVPDPFSNRNVSAAPFVGERAWLIASNALAAMIERWPQYARNIPRNDFDEIVRKGRDLQSLISALGRRTTESGNPLLDELLHQYETAASDFATALQAGLADVVQSIGSSDLGLSREQIAAIQNGLFLDKPIDVQYVPQSVSIHGTCGGARLEKTIAAPVIGRDMYSHTIGLALALNQLAISGCVGFKTGPVRTVEQEHVYGLLVDGRDIGPVCAGMSSVELAELSALVTFTARVRGSSDDGTQDYVFAVANGPGREVELRYSPLRSFHWSGYSPGQGYDDLNGDCARAYRRMVGQYYHALNFDEYYRTHWDEIRPVEPAVPGQSGIFIEGRMLEDLERVASEANQQQLEEVFAALHQDTAAVLSNGAPSRLSPATAAALKSSDIALEGTRALLRAFCEAAFELALQRDDVLHGLLFGSEAIPGQEDLVALLSLPAGEGESSAERLRRVPNIAFERAASLGQRLQQLMTDLTLNVPEGHSLLDQTLTRLNRVSCAVPETFQGAPTCDAPHRRWAVPPAAGRIHVEGRLN